MAKGVTITMTAEQAEKLMVILIQAKPRHEEGAAAWASFAEDKHEDGTPKFPSAQSNAEFNARCAGVCQEVKVLLSKARFEKRKQIVR